MATNPFDQFDSAPTAPVIAQPPTPQTPAQAQGDVLANEKTEAQIRAERANATVAEHKANEEALADQKQSAAKLSAIESADQLIGAVHRARALVSGWSTGLGGAVLDHVPASQAAQLDTIVNQEIRGNIFLNRVNALKEENPSPTGGTGIGRIMQAEIPLITGSIGALDPVKMGRQGTLDSLNQIEARTLRTKAIINGENPDDPAVQKKYGIPPLPTYGADGTTPAAPGPTSPSGPSGNPSGTPTDLSSLNEQMRAMFHAGASTDDILKFGKDHNLYPNPDEINKARQNGMDVQFVQPTGQPQGLDQQRVDQPGIGRQLLADTATDVAGIVKGAGGLPDALATGAGKVMSIVPTVIGYGADALGLNNAGSALHGVASNLANPPTIRGGVESVVPAPTTTGGKVNDFVGQLVGGALVMPTTATERAVARFVGEAPKLPPSGSALSGAKPGDVATALKDENIPAGRPVADPSVRGKMSYLETTRGGHNVVQSSLAQTRQSIANKVANLGGEGEVQTPGAAGEVIQSAGKRTLQNMKDAARQVYTQADQTAAGAPIRPTAALEKLDSYIEQMSRNPETNDGVLSYLKGVRSDLAAPGGKTVGDIRDIITGANDKINYQNLGRTRAEGIMSEVSKALNTDVSRDLGTANPQALSLYNKADGMWRDMSNLRQQVVKKLIGPADNPISGESAMNRVSAMMGNKGDLNRFKRVINMMTPEEQASFRSSLWEGIGQKSADEPFSPATFVTQTRGMQADALKTVFGEDGAKSIQNLRVASKGLSEAQSSLNNSRSGFVANFKDVVSSIMSLKSAGAGAVGYAVGGLPGAAAASAGSEALRFGANRLSAKVLMNPEVSQWIRKVAAVKTDKEARALISKLNGLGAGNAALQSFRDTINRALNDNVPPSGAAVASPDQRPDQQQ